MRPRPGGYQTPNVSEPTGVCLQPHQLQSPAQLHLQDLKDPNTTPARLSSGFWMDVRPVTGGALGPGSPGWRAWQRASRAPGGCGWTPAAGVGAARHAGGKC